MSIQISLDHFLAELNKSISLLLKKKACIFTCWDVYLHEGKITTIQGRHPVYLSEAYSEWDFHCFDLHQVLFTWDGTERWVKKLEACSDILFSFHTLLNFHLLECAFNAFLTNGFLLVGSLGMDLRCRGTHFLLLHKNCLNHKMLLCVYCIAMLTANELDTV